MAWSLDDRTGPMRPLQVTCTLVVRWWASSLRRSPHRCAAAPDLGPLAWPASSLRRSSHGRAGSRYTAGRAAPPVRVSGASPGLPADCKLQRTGRSTDRFFTDPDQDRQDRLPPDCLTDSLRRRLGPRQTWTKTTTTKTSTRLPQVSLCPQTRRSSCPFIPPAPRPSLRGARVGGGTFHQRNWGGAVFQPSNLFTREIGAGVVFVAPLVALWYGWCGC